MIGTLINAAVPVATGIVVLIAWFIAIMYSNKGLSTPPSIP